MTSKDAEILVHPDPHAHILYAYTDEAQLAEAVCLFASAGLHQGEAILLVILNHHRDPVRRCLETEGFDVKTLEGTGQLVWKGAEDLLSTVFFDGTLDEYIYKTSFTDLIEKTQAGQGTPSRSVRVFGEMVELVWRDRPRATERIEELCDEIIKTHSVPVLCAYSLTGNRPISLPEGVLEVHSHSMV